MLIFNTKRMVEKEMTQLREDIQEMLNMLQSHNKIVPTKILKEGTKEEQDYYNLYKGLQDE